MESDEDKMDQTAPLVRIALEPTSTEDPAWRAALDAEWVGPHGSPAWIEYRRAMGWQPLALLGRGEGDSPGLAGIAWERRPSWRPWMRPEVSLDRAPWGVGSPDPQPQQAVEAVLELARRRRWRSLQLHSFDGPSPPPSFEGPGWTCSERHEFLWTLGTDEEARLAGLKGSHRRKLRKAWKSGVEVEQSTAPEAIAHLQRLQGATQGRRQERGESMDCPRPEQYRIMARTLLPSGARCFLGRFEDEVVSAVLLCVHGPRAYYFLGGTGPRGLELNAAPAVMWEAARQLAADGVHLLNLGGVPLHAEREESLEHGLYRFKDGWGAERVLCRSGRWNPSEAGP